MLDGCLVLFVRQGAQVKCKFFVSLSIKLSSCYIHWEHHNDYDNEMRLVMMIVAIKLVDVVLMDDGGKSKAGNCREGFSTRCPGDYFLFLSYT